MSRNGLAHSSGTGTSSMHDHNGYSACQISTKINRYDRLAGSPPGIDILTRLR